MRGGARGLVALVCICRGNFTSLFVVFAEQVEWVPAKLAAEGGTGTTGIRWRLHHFYTDAGQPMWHCERCGCAKSVCTADKRVWCARRRRKIFFAFPPPNSPLLKSLFPPLEHELFRSPCLITLTAHCRMPACPNLRVNWNRKLEQMLFSQNSFREPIFNFSQTLKNYLFSCSSAGRFGLT